VHYVNSTLLFLVSTIAALQYCINALEDSASHSVQVDSLQAVLTQALQLLVVYLVDQNVPFIKHVHIALRQLLTIPQGLAAMQHLEPLQQAYLQVFAAPKRAANIPEPTARCHPVLSCHLFFM
jgi:hypothetical protein